MSDSRELRKIRRHILQLETALKGIDRELVYLLHDHGFFNDSVRNELLDPRSMLDESEKAGELVKRIENRVKQDPQSFYILLRCLKQRGILFQPIVNILESTECTDSPRTSSSCTGGGSQVHAIACAHATMDRQKKRSIKEHLRTGIEEYFGTRPEGPIAVTVKDRELNRFWRVLRISDFEVNREQNTFTATLTGASNFCIKADKERTVDGRVFGGGAAGAVGGIFGGGGVGAGVGGLVGIIGGPIGVGIGVAIGIGVGAAIGGVLGAGGGASGAFAFRKTVKCTVEQVFKVLGMHTVTGTERRMISVCINGTYLVS